jgi:hypothetical protein
MRPSGTPRPLQEKATTNPVRHVVQTARAKPKKLQRAGRRPNVKSVKEQDVVAALGRLRELLHGDVGVVAQVLKALVGDVVIERQPLEGQEKPQMNESRLPSISSDEGCRRSMPVTPESSCRGGAEYWPRGPRALTRPPRQVRPACP